MNVTFTFVGHFTNVEFNVNTLPGRDDLIILGLHWIKHGTGGPLITGKCVGQGDANTFKFFTKIIISTRNSVVPELIRYGIWILFVNSKIGLDWLKLENELGA